MEGCERQATARGFCSAHYQRWWRHGDPNLLLPVGRPRGVLSGASLRRAEMQQLYDEGLTLAQIGERFGVTRQRVAQLVDTKAALRARRARPSRVQVRAVFRGLGRLVGHQHGTLNRSRAGCKCERCRKANAGHARWIGFQHGKRPPRPFPVSWAACTCAHCGLRDPDRVKETTRLPLIFCEGCGRWSTNPRYQGET